MKLLKLVQRGLVATALLAAASAYAQTAIRYNCPPERADWGSQLRAIIQVEGTVVVPCVMSLIAASTSVVHSMRQACSNDNRGLRG